jgi:polyisoprenoid-binding protein YceI
MTTTASERTTVTTSRWSLERDGSSVGFTVKTMWGLIPVRGRFDRFAGIVEPLEFAATVQPAGDGLRVEATTTVDQRRFGMSSGVLGMLRRPATLHVEALLKRDADGRHHD